MTKASKKNVAIGGKEIEGFIFANVIVGVAPDSSLSERSTDEDGAGLEKKPTSGAQTSWLSKLLKIDSAERKNIGKESRVRAAQWLKKDARCGVCRPEEDRKIEQWTALRLHINGRIDGEFAHRKDTSLTQQKPKNLSSHLIQKSHCGCSGKRRGCFLRFEEERYRNLVNLLSSSRWQRLGRWSHCDEHVMDDGSA